MPRSLFRCVSFTEQDAGSVAAVAAHGVGAPAAGTGNVGLPIVATVAGIGIGKVPVETAVLVAGDGGHLR